MRYLSIILLVTLMTQPIFSYPQTRIEGQSAPVSLNIRKKKLPPILTVMNIRFEDTDRNSRMDGLESCCIKFAIENSGTGPATRMTMRMEQKSDIKGLDFNGVTSLTSILPSKSLDVVIPVTATIDLTNGQAVFAVSFEEPLGFPPDPFEVKVETRAFQSPQLKVTDFLFITDNGIVKTGLPVQLKTLIQNTGQGKAENVMVSFGYPQRNVFPNSEEQFQLGTINPGESYEVIFGFMPNKLYTEATIPVQVKLTEKYGRYGETKTVVATVDSHTENRTIAVRSTATDQRVTINTASLTAEVDKNIPENPQKSNHSYALVIGNEDYTTYQPGLNSESNVPFAVADARSFALYANKTLGIPLENITVIENGISSVMAREMEKLSKIIQYENGQAEVFLYYAGHGFPEETSGQSYLMPVDISGASVSQGIPLSKLYSDLTKNPAKRVTVFLDACFSGGGREAGILAARAVRIKPKDNPVSGNLVVFTASSGDQSALPYREKQHGMFTYYLLKTLQESKGNINYRSLFEKLKQNVELNAVKINNKDQNPSLIFSADVAGSFEEWQIY